MSTERYEIKGKIGEGGVGAVYHAYDTHLNRDVAIKRVLADGGYEDQEEATKSLLKEATALSSVQHPHIVTVYDAGVDADGPYVVMELIHGRTLDEMVERATMTWDDLREVALQSQEALIAAQDLDLVHRDLKPSNIMVCWLPSGKFQVKIVDFGLAKFSAAPSLQTIAHGDAVFGSIFFMAPEQFERIPLDKCTDMYSMGCLYYYALTGEYPFNGETAAMVMASHLQHHVTPLHELRPDIPRWGADWIMWHIERDMKARPQDARESLARLLLLDQQSTQPVTVSAANPTGLPAAAPPAAGAPQFIFPGAATGAVPTQPATGTAPVNPLTAATATQAVSPQTAPQSITPPNTGLNVHTGTHPVQQQVQPGTAPQFATGPQLTQYTTAPQQVQAAQLDTAAQQTQPGTAAQNTEGLPEEAETAPPKVKAGLPPVAKWTIIGLLALVIIVTAWIIFDGASGRKEAAYYKETMEETKKLYDDGELSNGYTIDKEHLKAVLNQAASFNFKKGSSGDKKSRPLQRATLAYAVGKDFDADEFIINDLTKRKMPANLRASLFEYSIAPRNHLNNADPLLTFAEETEGNHEKEVEKAIYAAHKSCVGHDADDYLPRFLDLLTSSDNTNIRKEALEGAFTIISQSDNKKELSEKILNIYESTIEPSIKHSLLRLSAAAGGEDAAKLVKKALSSDDTIIKNAAIAALSRWGDDSQFETLTDFISETDSTSLRKKAFDAAYSFLKLERERDPDDLGDLWSSLAQVAKSQREKLQIINGMANQNQNWAIGILDLLIKDTDDKVIDKAEQAKERVEENISKKE